MRINTKYLTTKDSDLREAAEIIKAGGLVAFPTETVYGLGGDAMNAQSSVKIYKAKGRPSDNPLIVHISEVEDVCRVAGIFPENARKLAEAIWPGPMTMVLPKRPEVPDETTGGLDTVALRCPASDVARKLIEYADTPLAAPSANISGRPSPTRWEHVRSDLDGNIDAVIMGEPCIGGIESTVIDMTLPDSPQILRPGLITPARIGEVLGIACGYDSALEGIPDLQMRPKSPGMKYRHYTPRAEMRLYRGEPEKLRESMSEDARSLRAQGKQVGTIVYEDGRQAAQNLFKDLRQMDDEGMDVILASALDDSEEINYSVMNRMLKAAGYVVKEI